MRVCVRGCMGCNVVAHPIFIYPLSGRPVHFVHLIPVFISSHPLTGRTDRVHTFQTLVPSHRAQQVFIYLEAHDT